MNNKDLVRIGLIILAALVLFYMLNNYSKNKNSSNEQFYFENAETPETENKESKEMAKVQAGESIDRSEIFKPVEYSNDDETPKEKDGEFGLSGNQFPNDCFPKDQLTPKDLLPSNANSKWAQVNPAGQGELGDQNFLEAAHHIGVNTVGQTLRNANLQIRSEPPNPQVKVSPWLQSTIEPDTNRKPLEIGGCE